MMWLNGELVEAGVAAARIAASSAGATLGWGVFTTLGVREGEPRFLARHANRLERDARAAQVPFDLDFAGISRAVGEVLGANRVRNGLARLTLTRRGDGRWNSAEGADFSVLALEIPPLAPEESVAGRQTFAGEKSLVGEKLLMGGISVGSGMSVGGGMRVALSPYRVEARSPLCGIKTTSYLPYLWAWREARARGFDEAILRDGRDFLSEGARASLFWMRDGVLHTPSLRSGCLLGIGRDLTLEWAASQGLPVREGEFAAREAEAGDEMWLVSAATGPRHVASWHDEESTQLARFSEKSGFCSALSVWFEAKDE